MSISLPSKTIYVVDVPEATNLQCEFAYNFHTPDECINDVATNKPVAKKQLSVDTEFLDYVRLRIPRYVVISWKKPSLSSTTTVNNASSYDIRENLDKVMTEDTFASFDFSAVNFVDGDLENKVCSLVSSSIETMLVGVNTHHDMSMHKLSEFVAQNMPRSIESDLLFSAVTNPEKRGTILLSDAKRIVDEKFKELSAVFVNTQINTKVLGDIVNRGTNDPLNQYAGDMSVLGSAARERQLAATKLLTNGPQESEFKTIVPFVDVKVQRDAQQPVRTPVELIGYIIDKFEVSTNGDLIEHDPIVIQNVDITTTFDPNVRYGTTYVYAVRTVAVFTLTGVDVDTQDIAQLKVLISSKQSNKVYVATVEAVPPPPPADVNVVWDYELDKLGVYWSFPPNAQRDIKKFQVFRRESIDHPFELLKEYDFDDSFVKHYPFEKPDPRISETLSSPKTFFVDDEFSRQSKYIYAVCSIDAHGFTSSYSMQFEISFDQFKNKIIKKLISHSGAPKPYPNMYLEADAFVDVVKTTGMKRMRLYFNPQNYEIYDHRGKRTHIITSKRRNGSYKLQFINLDNQQGGLVNIDVDDRREYT